MNIGAHVDELVAVALPIRSLLGFTVIMENDETAFADLVFNGLKIAPRTSSMTSVDERYIYRKVKGVPKKRPWIVH